ncbi:hypothetical protein AVEN_20488-1 [Araneus ventricosus]|uniref:Uncharacterized protein n=1 Tax=Araneus ventricosus TaxID=182803 RepID=A0A4Y2TA12_ARAVE|nr:hypothetical protein AVEN_20488-1 [Araneus ventricosus]
MLPFPPSKNSARKRQFCVYKFASKKQVLSPLVISSSYIKIRCRTKPFFNRSLPEPKVIFFHWQGIETKINLVAPRRQTILRNSPTGPATPCARPRDLQIANKGSYDSSDFRSGFLRKKGRYCLDTSKG